MLTIIIIPDRSTTRAPLDCLSLAPEAHWAVLSAWAGANGPEGDDTPGMGLGADCTS
jgi:hypothetical protein